MDAWEEVVEKAIGAEVKVGLQQNSMIREIDFRCLKEHKPSVKKNKDDAYWKHHDEASIDQKKAKSHPSSSANQPQTHVYKNDKRHRSR